MWNLECKMVYVKYFSYLSGISNKVATFCASAHHQETLAYLSSRTTGYPQYSLVFEHAITEYIISHLTKHSDTKDTISPVILFQTLT